MHLLCDLGCDVSELLVVTFTEAAAAEMKSRIARSLSKRHAESPAELTSKHLAMLDRASIGTLHAFCSRVLRQNFHLMGLDPEFRIFDADEAALLKLETARDLFSDRYDDPDGDDFRRMVDCYADGNDDRLMRQVMKTFDTLCSVVDPVEWLHNARRRVEEALDLPLARSEMGQRYSRYIRVELNSILRECAAAGNSMKKLPQFPMYVEHLRELWTILDHWLKVFNSDGIDALAEVSALELADMPRVSSKIEGKELAKARVDAIRESMKKGSWRKSLAFTTEELKDGLRITMPHLDVLLSLVADFAERYSAAKDEQRVLDFADLERLMLRALKADNESSLKPTALARSFHHQFKHVLVDEYQDINQVQDAILSLVSRECLAGKGGLPANLFCVGDVKQSIYRFRLAEAAQFLKRRDEYNQPNSHGRVIDLQQNFRSRAPLLEAINGVFGRLMTKEAADLDYDESQRLTPGQIFPDAEGGFVGSPIEFHLLPKDSPSAGDTETVEADLDRSEREAAILGHRILELTGRAVKPARMIVDRSAGKPITRPLRFGDIVLLLRSMRFKADQFAATLRAMGVPVFTESVTGYFEATEINDVLALLQVLDNQRQDIPLAALLRSPLAAMPNPEDSLAKIRLAYTGEPAVPFHLAVQKYAEEKHDSLAEFLRTFRATLERWRQEVRQRPVAEMLWNIYDETGYLTFCAGLPNGEQRQANLIELHDRARQFSEFRRQGLGRFLAFLEKLKQETDLGQASIASEADDVVRIMSVHRSKGQEFPVVLLPDLGKAFNMQDSQGSILLDREAGLGLQVIDEERQIRYPSLASTVVQQRLKQQAMAEELRVLYVAMTRAKEHLILAGTCGETLPAKWIEQWTGHDGPIPTEGVLSARTTLDWLGPTAATLPNQFDVQMHTAEEITGWSGEQTGPTEMTPIQKNIADLKPMGSAIAAVPNAVRAVIDRLNQRYAYSAVADVAAAVSATSLVKGVASNGSDPNLPTAPLGRLLTMPAFLAEAHPLTAADKGTATHVVLEHFDFGRDVDSIHEQIAAMVAANRLTPDAAKLVDVSAIEWFLQTEVGQLLKKNADQLKRELPVYYANPSAVVESADPMDEQMVRGRIDLLVPVADGWMIVDYKTDRVTGEALDARVTLYAGQLDIYHKAVQRITGKPVARLALVFLHPREIRHITS